ncbi:hypothetical protein S820908_201 [Synechococcus phage S-CAM9]|uniref:Uncharacterized protein n=1 Tax=Synechococcus phage S-CAM9 TaxID=1883369 RepID=A0A1D8KQ50_9CAUD|nr:hypothetical protein BOW85_gp047 [Synechococcus phage S-CAM9]AOV60348.1 hypothetical protein S050808_201 [Synechococcus phage S-CAM9]AOV60576.1 hypothetical protein S820908_201 [Synechococcus phage S-CAM9]AOV60805.1 hypothetical protein N161109_202 [Synechococcus phage S-CAM9]
MYAARAFLKVGNGTNQRSSNISSVQMGNFTRIQFQQAMPNNNYAHASSGSEHDEIGIPPFYILEQHFNYLTWASRNRTYDTGELSIEAVDGSRDTRETPREFHFIAWGN